MTCTFDCHEGSIREKSSHPAGDGHELGIGTSGDQEHRASHMRERIPKRMHRASSHQPQLHRQCPGAVAHAVFDHGLRQTFEHRLCKPSVQEDFNPVSFDLCGELFIRCAPVAAFSFVFDAWSYADEHEGVDEVGLIDCKSQTYAPSHRIADINRLARGSSQTSGRVGKILADRKIDAYVPRICLQMLDHRCPRARGLCKAVDEREFWHEGRMT